jgi:hypothetical protein
LAEHLLVMVEVMVVLVVIKARISNQQVVVVPVDTLVQVVRAD